MSQVRENYRRLLDRIGEASLRSGRKPEAVRLIGVSKRVTVERVREAVEAGLTNIGENRVQEAQEKFSLMSDLSVTRHLIGHLQSNKARSALQLFSWIQSLDSRSLARRLDRLAPEPTPVLIQVKLASENTKAGAEESDLAGLVETVRSAENLQLRGLMAIPPFFPDGEQMRPYFARLRGLAERYGVVEISMGMSHDFEIAIEEGATMVRVGTALFGERA